VADPGPAEDLAAQTFSEALRSRARYPGRAAAGPWLYGIAHNLLRGHRRAEERQLRAYARTGVDPAAELDVEAEACAGMRRHELAMASGAYDIRRRRIVLETRERAKRVTAPKRVSATAAPGRPRPRWATGG
jgi:DNA-directed RNA polymerase specialized sigma24 family protein